MARYVGLLLVLLLPGVLQAAERMTEFTMPKPPGPHCPVSAEQLKEVESYRADRPLVGTHFFYWYDMESKAHFVNHDGSDALTDPSSPQRFTVNCRLCWSIPR
ncbi:MAG: hypothetical protein GXY83_20155 [Rhodopirellula sp.]|nr:hypothetical protein [Rhodopirellula sp.]